MSLWLPASIRDELVRWSAAEHPQEACGLLLGTRSPRVGEYRVHSARRAANVAPAPRTRRFEVAPLDLLEADRAARAAQLEVVGIWHSHPERSAEASEQDRRGAYAGWAYLILGAGGELRAWQLHGEQLEQLEVCEGAALSADRTP